MKQMRKILSFAAIAAFVLGCSSCNKQAVPEQGEGTVIKTVSVDLGGSTRTRAASALAGEATINDATLFVWQHNGVSEPVLYAKTYAEATVFNFDLMFSDQTEYTYTINAWANMGELSAEPADSEVLFSNESADGVQMKGSKTGITQATAESVTIDMQRYVGKITVSEVAVEWTNEQNALQEFTLKSMYIANAGDKAEGAVAAYNVGGTYVSSTMDAMLYSPVSSVIADGAKYSTPQMMYAYGSGTTELVLECELGGQTMYYHVPYEPEANTHRAFKLTIRQSGADEPLGELPEEAIVANVTTLNVLGFDESEDDVDFGQTPVTYNMVDLGLPSGLKWADRNVGAASPQEYGLFFAWGETEGCVLEDIPEYSWSGYFDTNDSGNTFVKYTQSGQILNLEDDAAFINMGSDWRMPTMEEFRELRDNTTTFILDSYGNETAYEDRGDDFDYSSVVGVRLEGVNGNSVYIPIPPYSISYMTLWTSILDQPSMAWCIHMDYVGVNIDISDRCVALNVRAVSNL